MEKILEILATDLIFVNLFLRRIYVELIIAGANPNLIVQAKIKIKVGDLSSEVNIGLSLLAKAAESGLNTIVSILLFYGADHNFKEITQEFLTDEEDKCPLILAIRGGYIETVETLLNHGVHANQPVSGRL